VVLALDPQQHVLAMVYKTLDLVVEAVDMMSQLQ
tara:strand:- start:228 stop:329 length:102 start_codon:yes stop_codon:yes gene_type:complete